FRFDGLAAGAYSLTALAGYHIRGYSPATAPCEDVRVVAPRQSTISARLVLPGGPGSDKPGAASAHGEETFVTMTMRTARGFDVEVVTSAVGDVTIDFLLGTRVAATRRLNLAPGSEVDLGEVSAVPGIPL